MRKVELVQRIAAELGCTIGQAEAAVEATLTAIKQSLQQGDRSFCAVLARGRCGRSGHASVGTPKRAPPRPFQPGGSSALS